MKNGLSENPSRAEQTLFASLSPADRKILSRGFGPNVYMCWTLWPGVQPKSELSARGQGDIEFGLTLIRGEV